MIYNIHYDICAIVIYLFTIYCILAKKGIRKNQNKVFFLIVVNGLVAGIFDISSAIANSYPYDNSLLVMDICNYGYLGLHNILPAMFCLYVILVSGAFRKMQPKTYGLLAVPLCINLLVLCLNPAFGWVFYYGEGLKYTHGFMMYWLYFSAVVYVIGISGYYMWNYRTAIPKNKKNSMLLYIVCGVLSVLLQYFMPNILLELFVQSLAFLGILFTIENEDELYNGITKVYNRRAFLMENSRAIEGKLEYCVVSIRISDIRYYIATLGVVAVNEILKAMAEWLNKIGENIEVYDCENGVFSLITYKNAERQTEEILKAVEARFARNWEYGEISIAFKIQICAINVPGRVDSLEKLLTLIDTDYIKSDDSDNRVSVLHDKDLKFLYREVEVERAVKEALENKTLKVFYQPIWNREANAINSAEALIRLFDHKLGNVPPEEFIPIAEKSGIIGEIGEFVFEEVCRLFYEKNVEQLGITSVNINLSAVQCMHRDLAKRFKDILKRYEIKADSINLEITESAAASNPEIFLHTMKQLRKLGFKSSMDDYGTGYSNFSYMIDLDFDTIKIDKSILWNADKNESAKIILKNTIRMIKEMGMATVIEGVETQAQKNYVSELGCDYCQGYYFARPMDRDNFIQYCKKFNSKKEG